MLGRLAAVLAATLLASGLTAPPAAASHQFVACSFVAVSETDVTGRDTWEGVGVGYLIGDAGEAVSIQCTVKVNGGVRSATDWGTGSTAAASAGRVTFTRTPTEVTQLCARYTTSHGAGERCWATVTTQVPPQEVYDALDGVFDLVGDVQRHVVDPALCPFLQSLNGQYGPNAEIEIKPGTGGTGGDVYVNGELFWDCPGYETGPQPGSGPIIEPLHVTSSINTGL